MKGIEPSLSAWEAEVLPLNYTRKGLEFYSRGNELPYNAREFPLYFMSDTCLIVNATAVNEGRVFETDLLIRDAHIEKMGTDLSSEAADQVIDASGLHLLPGMIDGQVHFREPGQAHKATFRSESRAAVAGGITSVMDMPNNHPPIITRERLQEKLARAQGAMHTNYAFYFGAANTNLDEVSRLDPSQVCGLKIFMGASTGDMLVDDPVALEGMFAESPVLIATHCEDTPMIEAELARHVERYGEHIPMECHVQIRSREACLASSSKAVELARKHGARLHVLHLTTGDELHLFEPGAVENKRITAEVCVHHLVFAEEDYAQHGGRIKCNPSIKTSADREALRQALRENQIDVIATDHAPHLLSEKEGDYREVAAGLPFVQHALPMVLELAHQGMLELPEAVHKVAHAPALCYGVRERGFLREGYFADLTLVDLSGVWPVQPEEVLHQVGWSAFEGQQLHARIDRTWVSGQLAYAEGRVTPEALGQRLEFDHAY